MRLQAATIELVGTNRNPARPHSGPYSSAQLKQQYAVKILGTASISIVDVTLARSAIAQCGVLDVEAPRSEALDIIDNGYYLVRFAQAQCPVTLKT
ncbi:hypothetical protein PI124_g19454 [Phytophthora idaei]|nr:hypothetical protein PI125_g20683 [Phytophthora idaei]KAG3133590.1 hypothetical protein PI126_g19104 [Phytophthora idaei]KAG3235513.1 hypothetical protein PI124_g19454 [Phytophthora idaei]